MKTAQGQQRAREIRYQSLYNSLCLLARQHGGHVKILGSKGMVTVKEAKKALKKFARENGINLQGSKK